MGDLLDGPWANVNVPVRRGRPLMRGYGRGYDARSRPQYARPVCKVCDRPFASLAAMPERRVCRDCLDPGPPGLFELDGADDDDTPT